MTRRRLPDITSVYLEVRPKLIGVCNAIRKKYGGQPEDLLSEAHEHFVDVYRSHDPRRGTLEGDLVFRVYHRMLETVERESRHKRHLNAVQADEWNVSSEDPHYFDLYEFLAELSHEARKVVKIALEPPPDVEMEFVQERYRRRGLAGGPSWGKLMRESIRKYLEDLDWSAGTVRASFNEITKALRG